MFDDIFEFRHEGASCEVHIEDGVGYIYRVYSKTRSQGHAKALMRKVTEWADERDLALRLHARAYGGPVQTMLDNHQLVQFYKSAGFEIDSEFDPGLGTMMDRPSQKKQAL